jgi:hypothetical protein
MAFFDALGVVIMLADPATEPAAAEVATDAVDVAPAAESEPAAMPDPALEPDPAFVYEPDPALAYDPEPEPEDAPPNTRWRGGPYFTFGIAPMATMDLHAHAHPGLRYDMETGLAWKRSRVRTYFGPDFHLVQYFGRKKPGFGVDAMATVSLRHVYARVGLGAAMGMPASADVNDTRPMLGGILGGGLVGRTGKAEGRLGVDYDLRVDTAGRVAQTVLLTLRLTFGP